MRDHLDEHPQASAPAADHDHMDLQRAAMRELIALSTESVQPAESEIEQRYRKAAEAAERTSQETKSKIETRLAETQQADQQRFQEQVKQIRDLYESDLNALAANTKAVHKRIAVEAESSTRGARKDLEQELWLAESVAEAARNQIRKDRKRIGKDVPARTASLESLHQQAEWLVREYRQEPPEVPPPADDQASTPNDPISMFRRQYQLAQENLGALEALRIPRLFIGVRPYAYAVLLCTAFAVLAGWLTITRLPQWWLLVTVSLALLGGLAVVLLAGNGLRQLAQSHVKGVYVPLQEALARARLAVDRYAKLAAEQLQEREAQAARTLEEETRKAKERFEPLMAKINQRRESLLKQADDAHTWLRSEIESRRDKGLQQAEEELRQRGLDLQQRCAQSLDQARERHEQQMNDCRSRYESARSALEDRWKEGLSCIEALLDETARINGLFLDWDDPSWPQWRPPRKFASLVRFGQWAVDLNRLAGSVRQHARFKIEPAQVISVPAFLAFPEHCSLLLQTQRGGLEEAIRTLRAVMVRLLTSLPAGRVRFTIIDPVGLGENFAGFMHLADYEEALVGGRIWTDSAHIEQRLTDLTSHMENVIQKYLRNEFDTIEAYNLQAGELAEPYRFLVIANFPANFTEEAARRLSSIASSGARCGVYTLIAHDTRQELPPGFEVEDLKAGGIHLVHENDRFVWQDEVFRQFPLALDGPPAEGSLTQIMRAVGEGARDSIRVEVPFETIAPPAERYWKSSSSEDLCVPIGRSGAVRLQHLRLGRGVAQHTLIAGKTGSGKSTLLHVIVTNLALWYSPQEVEFYLVDFKKGVEFKTYATHELAHARAVAIESDREFGLSVLQRIDAEMEHRGNLFRRAGVQDLSSYRQSTGAKLPRTLLIVDEFQVFFSEDDKLAQDAAILLDRLVRQGRAFGIHVLLGSQTLAGTSGLARSTIGQMAVRVALQCSDVDSQLILDDNNVAARLLSRPGEAIYNDAGGLVEGNSPFQTAWLSDEQRDEYLNRVRDLAGGRTDEHGPLIVFEGNAPADIGKNRLLAKLLEAPGWPASETAPRVWLGEAVAIKEPTSATFRRQSGANLLLVGQRDDAALAMMTAAMVSLAAQHSHQSARFIVLDGSPADSPLSGGLQRVASALPHSARLVEWRSVADVIAELAGELHRRQGADDTHAPAVYLLIYGLQRYRVLRRGEDEFSFSSGNADKPPDPDKQFAELLREGPPLGIHTLLWSDTPATLDRTFDRQAMREFDNRVLFQMSAADSSNLIDSPAANRLGFHRALFHSEEQGLLEKFRPYALLDQRWLEQTAARLKGRITAAGADSSFK